MSISAFDDKTQPPNEGQLLQTLGTYADWWRDITAFMQETYQLPCIMTYGGKNYGWNAWYRRKSRSLLSIYPRDQGITVQVVLGKKEVEKALLLPLGPRVSQALRETPAFHDGLWLFIPLECPRDVEDILQLVQLKSRPRRGNAESTGQLLR